MASAPARAATLKIVRRSTDVRIPKTIVAKPGYSRADASEGATRVAEVSAPTAEDRPRPDGGDIRKLTAGEVDAVARSLADAFYDDPHMSWIFPADGRRRERLERG